MEVDRCYADRNERRADVLVIDAESIANWVSEGSEVDWSHRACEPWDCHKSWHKYVGEQQGEESPAQIALPGLLGRQGNELVWTEEIADQIGKYVVADDEQHGQDEPDNAPEWVHDDEPALQHHHDGGEDDPSEEPELVLEEALL